MHYKFSVGIVVDGFEPAAAKHSPSSVEAAGEKVMPKLTLLMALVFCFIPLLAIACGGDQGPEGREGPQGSTGKQGSTGPQGPQGVQGPTGSEGQWGEQ
jgi:hypothetical protein